MVPFSDKQLQQLRNGGDLVRLGVRGDLRQHEALIAAPGGDHVERRLAAGLVEGTTQHLAVWGAVRLSETSGCGKLNRNRR